MEDTRLQLEVVTPERAVLTDEVDEIVLPGEEGEMGIRPGHVPLLTSLGIGEMVVRDGKEERSFVVVRGFAEVLSDRVRVLAQECEGVDEIDIEAAKAALAEAEEGMRELKKSEPGEADQELEGKYRESLKKARTQLMLSGESDELDEE
jgi:F-type H+-transporting ATPase subunit epsilon